MKSISLRVRTTIYVISVVIPLILTSLIVFLNARILLQDATGMFSNNLFFSRINKLSQDLHIELSKVLISQRSQDTLQYFRISAELEGLKQELFLRNQIPANANLLINMDAVLERYLDLSQDALNSKRGRFVEEFTGIYIETERYLEMLELLIEKLNATEYETNILRYLGFTTWYNDVQIIGILLVADVSLLSLVLIWLLSYRLSRPITNLASATKKIAQGNFTLEDIPIEGSREVQALAENYNTMKHSIVQYIHQIEANASIERELMEKNIQNLRMGNLLKIAELIALQAQINPHFLFNTLNSGMNLALVEGADKTADYLERLAEVYRFTLKNLDKDVTLKEELEGLEHFIYIMKIRFPDRIRYEFDIADEMLDVRIPSMLLQPLIENAIAHGLKDRESGGLVSITGYIKEQYAILDVRDNGVGISKQLIEEVLQADIFEEHLDRINEETKTGGVGLSNVIQRVKLFYGRDDLVSIEGNSGTLVRIAIPLMEVKHHD
jgi:two-component system sensor histidine kinase YesM